MSSNVAPVDASVNPTAGEITLTTYAGARRPKPTGVITFPTWAELCEDLPVLLGKEAKKIDMAAIGPHTLAKPHRCDRNVERLTLLVIDVDRCDVNAVLERVAELGIAAAVYGSPSDDPARPQARRVRILAPVTRPIAPGECALTRQAFADLLGIPPESGVEGALDASRLFFIGREPGTPEREYLWTDGAPVDVDALLRFEAPAPPAPAAPPPRVAAGGRRLDPAQIDAAVALLEPHATLGQRHRLAHAIGGYLCNAGVDRADAETVVAGLPSDDPAARVRDAGDAYRQAHPAGASALRALGVDVEALDAATRDPLVAELRERAEAKRAAATRDDDLAPGGRDPEVEAAIDHVADPRVGVFQRGGALVHVTRDPLVIDGQTIPGGRPSIHELGPARLKEIIRTSGGRHLEKLAAAVTARGEWRAVRPLDGIASYPVLRPDGTVLARSGYDLATRTMATIDSGLVLRGLDAPTRADAIAGRERLEALVSDFPFADAASRASWIACLLAVLARPAIDGPTPLGLLDASARASGKTLLADLLSVIATGERVPRTVAPKTREEWDKSMLVWLMGGAPIMLIDNAVGLLSSDALDAVLTGTHYAQRLLGASEERRVAVRAVFLVSANNCRISSDLVRRSIRCRLEPDCEKPEERTGFRYPRLLAHAAAHRAEYLSAALAIVRAYALAERPAVNARPVGSFESWASVVRDALVWADGADPIETQDDLRDSADAERDEVRDLLRAWHEVFAERAVTVREVIDAATGQAAAAPGQSIADRFARPGTPAAALQEALRGVLPNGAEPTPRNVGNRLKALRKQIVGGLMLAPAGEECGVARWRVVAPAAR